MTNKTYLWKNKAGWCYLTFSDEGIVKFSFGFRTRKEAFKSAVITGEKTVQTESVSGWVKKAVSDIDRYFSGTPVRFDSPTDFSNATAFQKKVWRAAMGIPYGNTSGYAELARAIGLPRAARAVGNALGANPIPIMVPCHRVLKSDGSLGGFAIGTDVKKALILFEEGKPVNFENLNWER